MLFRVIDMVIISLFKCYFVLLTWVLFRYLNVSVIEMVVISVFKRYFVLLTRLLFRYLKVISCY